MNWLLGLYVLPKTKSFLLDNSIDESTITHLSKKAEKTKVLLFTKTISKQMTLDIKKSQRTIRQL
jgi:hypothetical protein